MRLEVDAILFDIDGTLVDSTDAVEGIWTTWAARRGLDAAEILEVSHGRRTEDTLRLFLPEDSVAEAVAELAAMEHAEDGEVLALPGVAELLAALPKERWAAVTSGTRTVMLPRLASAGLPEPSVLVAAEDVRVGKPDPEGYRLAAEQLGHDVTRCLVVEDAPAGIEAARAAGAASLGVATSHDRDVLRGADEVVADLTSLTVSLRPDGLVVTTA